MSPLLMGAGRSVHNARYILEDNFIETGDTAIASHTPDFNSLGNPWVSAAGTWTVKGDGSGVEHATNTCEDAAVIDLGTPDVDITVVTNPSTDQGDFGVCFRYSSLTAWYFYDYDTSGGRMRIVKFNPGASVIAENTGDPLGAFELTWRVRAKGSLLEGWIEGVANTLCSVSDSDLITNTKHGIRHCLVSADVRYKSIKVAKI